MNRRCRRCANSAPKSVCMDAISTKRESKLSAGVGTMGLEIFDGLPDVDVIIAPAGGGSCASGNSIVARHLNPGVQVIAVQSESAPAMWHAWKNRTLDP